MAESDFSGMDDPYADMDDPYASAGGMFAEMDDPYAPKPEVLPEPEEEHGVVSTMLRGVGERAMQVGGGLADFAADTGRNLEEKYPMGGFIESPDSLLGMKYANAEEYQQKVTPDSEFLERAAVAGRDADFGYEEMVSTQDIKDEWNDGDVAGLVGKSLGFGTEQFIKSLPDMAAVLSNLPIYIQARTGELAQERAAELGMDQPSSGEQAVAGGAAVVSAMLEKFGAKKVFGGSEAGDTLAKEVVKAAAAEGSTEFAQEAIEYAGVKAGTGNFDWAEGAEQAGFGMLGGTVGGGGMTTIQGITNRALEKGQRNAYNKAAADQARQEAMDLGGDELDGEIAAQQVYIKATEFDPAPITPTDFEPDFKGNLGLDIPYTDTPIDPAGGLAEDGYAPDDFLPYAKPDIAGDSLSLMDMKTNEESGNAIDYVAPVVPSQINEKASNIENMIEEKNYADSFGAPDPENPMQAAYENETEPMVSVEEQNDTERKDLTEDRKSINQNLPAVENKGNKTPANEKMELQHAITAYGGLSRDDATEQGIDEAELKRQVGVRRVFTKKGKSFDEMAESLAQDGWFGEDEEVGASRLLEKLSESMSGTEQYTPSGSEIQAERMAGEEQIDQIDQRLYELGDARVEDQNDPPTGQAYTALSEPERELSYNALEAEALGIPEVRIDQMLDMDATVEEINSEFRGEIDHAKQVRDTKPAQKESESSDGGNEVAPSVASGEESGGEQASSESGEVDPASAEIDARANEAATSETNDRPEPTEAQKEAGNYKKGTPFSMHGQRIVIENPRGSQRKGTDPDGNEWSNTMGAHYGDLKGTVGADGDAIDVFVGDNPKSEKIFVIDQQKNKGDKGGFDEHKVFMGFDAQISAEKAYLDSYDTEWNVGAVTELSTEEFNQWLEGDTTKPLSTGKPAASSVKETPIKQGDVSVGDTVYYEDITDKTKRLPANFRGIQDGNAVLIPDGGMQMSLPSDRVFKQDVQSKAPPKKKSVGATSNKLKQAKDARAKKQAEGKPLSEIMVSEEFQDEDGNSVTVEQDAETAIRQIDKRLGVMDKLLECLG